MTILKLRDKVFAVLDGRNLAQPSRRKNAFHRVADFIRASKYCNDGEVILPRDKKQFKQDYAIYKKDKNPSGAENSVINEIYEQYGL